MAGGFLTVQEVLALLAETPPRIAAPTADLTSAQARAAPAPGEWSANEVLAHLRACADVWGRCIATILAEDRPTWRAVNPTTWIGQTDYPTLDFRTSLRAFAAQRDELLAVLGPLPPAAWSRAALVTGEGKPRERTVLSYAQRLARHERAHVKQIARIASAVAR